MMSRTVSDSTASNRVRRKRLELGLSQEALAARAGLSRTEVSAIENARVTPSVTAGIALARALDCSAELLFSSESSDTPSRWAGPVPNDVCRVWFARNAFGARTACRAERTHAGTQLHDATWDGECFHSTAESVPERTLILAGCDPAAGGLVGPLAELGVRLIPLVRSSRNALTLLREGRVHIAGFHLGEATAIGSRHNMAVAEEALGANHRWMRLLRWQEGLVVRRGSDVSSAADALRRPLRWLEREPGSGAQLCLEHLLTEYGAERPIRAGAATDHYGVAQGVSMGWADIGVCTRLVAEQVGLRFLPVRHADYDVCWPLAMDDDPRVQAFVKVIGSRQMRTTLGSLPGYETRCTGDTAVLGTA